MVFDNSNRHEAHLIELAKNKDPRGNLSVIESGVAVQGDAQLLDL